MPKKALFIDENSGKTKELDVFVYEEFGQTGPNKPVKTNEQGVIPYNFVPRRTPRTETITLNTSHIQNKKILLNESPDSPSNVVLTPAGGPVQINGIDFEVIGNELTWNSMGLDNFLEQNDVLVINY